jgi:serine/threonine protein kinase
MGIMHRDIKPQNILIDRNTGDLKICDLGSAKAVDPTEKGVSYVASRSYRAPELLFDCVYYTTAIDVWAAGCCVAELLMSGTPLFVGESSIGQLEAIAKFIRSPTDEDLRTFPHNANIQLNVVQSVTLEQFLPRHTPPDFIDLLAAIFVYPPAKRPTARDCMNHYVFDEIFELKINMPSGKPLPPLERP